MSILDLHKRKYVDKRWERKFWTVYRRENPVEFTVKSEYLPHGHEWGINDFKTLEEADAWAKRAIREHLTSILNQLEEQL